MQRRKTKMNQSPLGLDVMAEHKCLVQWKAILIIWVVVSLQVKFERHGFTPLSQLAKRLGNLSTYGRFSKRKLFSSLSNTPLHISEKFGINVLFRTSVKQIAL